MEATQTPTKTTIRPNTKDMVKTAGGSFHKADTIGYLLAGLSLAQVKHIAVESGVDVDKYAHLNNGQQRMTIGGILRKLVKVPIVAEGTEATDKQKEDTATAVAVLSQIETLANNFREANKAEANAKASEKEAAKAAKLVEAKNTTDITGDTDSEGGTLD